MEQECEEEFVEHAPFWLKTTGLGLSGLTYRPTLFGSLVSCSAIIAVLRIAWQPADKAYLDAKFECRDLVTQLCDAYLVILPKLMGCVVCQYAHSLVGSQRYVHYQVRKEQLLQLKEKIGRHDYNPRAILCFIETTMCPFQGEFGEHFYQQCKLALNGVIQKLDEFYDVVTTPKLH